MNLSDFKQRESIIRTEWFKHHRAVFQDWPARSVAVLTWRRPDTINYFTRYLINGRVLCVYGDLGEAVFEWGQEVTFAWVAKCDLGYFEGKCQASEKGRHFQDWDALKARKEMARHLKEDPKARKQWAHYGDDSAFNSEAEWQFWLNANGSDVFPDYYCELGDIGAVTALRCQAYLVGIQMAVAQRELQFCPEI